MSTIDEMFPATDIKPDYELAINIVRQWGHDNARTDIDWRQMHAASIILALRLREAAQDVSERKALLMEAKQELSNAESKANLTAMVLLMAGRAKDADGQAIETKFSYSAAKDVSKKFEGIDLDVKAAQTKLVNAERNYTRAEKDYAALIQLSQGGKSIAQRLTQEPQ